GEAQELLELFVGGSVAEWGLQVPLAAREKAGAQLAVRGQADAVARRAERLRDRIHEPDLARAVREAEAARGGGRLRGNLLERPALLDDFADFPAREHLVLAPNLVG